MFFRAALAFDTTIWWSVCVCLFQKGKYIFLKAESVCNVLTLHNSLVCKDCLCMFCLRKSDSLNSSFNILIITSRIIFHSRKTHLLISKIVYSWLSEAWIPSVFHSFYFLKFNSSSIWGAFTQLEAIILSMDLWLSSVNFKVIITYSKYWIMWSFACAGTETIVIHYQQKYRTTGRIWRHRECGFKF